MSKVKIVISIIVVILFISSLGLNGYFINQKMKDNRQSDIDWGKHIIQSYYDAAMFAGIIRDATDGILKDNTLEQRLSYKYQIGLASKFTQSIPSLIANAEQINGKPFMQMKYTPQLLFVEINNVLGGIAGHNGKLTDDEITLLKTTNELFVEVDELLKGYMVKNSADDLALDMTEGGTWVGIVEQINNLFVNTPDLEFIFMFRSTHEN